jgi:hemerythrin
MALFTWNNNYSVGVASIDKQHMSLFDSLNELHNAMLQGKAKEVTGTLLRNLLAYTREHFSSEEAMLLKASFPDLAKHRQRHADFTRQVSVFLERYERGDLALNVELMTVLRDWLSNHIMREDHSYRSCLAQRGIC